MTEGCSPSRSRADVLRRVRGALARPTDSEDDPFRRVLLLRPSGRSRSQEATFQVAAEDLAAPLETVGARLRERVRQWCHDHGHSPACVRLPWGEDREIVVPDPDVLPPLEGKTALVTGAAGAIGAELCQSLLQAGCRVLAGDVSVPGLEALVREGSSRKSDETCEVFDPRLLGVRMDVTDAASVAEAFDTATQMWGGVDIVIANAGMAHVADLETLELEAFRRLERVNLEGTLLTLAEAGRCLKAQGTGGDIVLISTKNVFAPGASFGAYSATKAAAHQLARIASLEFAPWGVRVNMVAPDAVFGDAHRPSGLWAEVGPSRMRARGLDEKGLQEYYRNRNLLKAKVTPRHVARAVLFFVTRQTPTTGATLPVDGGLPDATPR